MDNIVNIPNLEKIDFKNNKIIDEEYDEKLKKLNEKMKNRSNTTTTITKIKTTTKTTIK
ncbi:hypothetical protein LY90DRAFT_709635, partial [Neocallimastix californiae]